MRGTVLFSAAAVIAAVTSPVGAQTSPTMGRPNGARPEVAAPTAVPTVRHRSTSFLFVTVPHGGGVARLAIFGFKAAVGGVAVVRARGYCNLSQEAANNKEINIESRLAGTPPFKTPYSSWGVLRVPANASLDFEQIGWTSEQEFPVVKGTTYTVVLSGRNASAVAFDSNCSGTIAMDIM